MQLKLNHEYKTRNGDKFTVTNIDYSYSKPFHGMVETKGKNWGMPASYSQSGIYNPHNPKDSPYDIVGPWEQK